MYFLQTYHYYSFLTFFFSSFSLSFFSKNADFQLDIDTQLDSLDQKGHSLDDTSIEDAEDGDDEDVEEVEDQQPQPQPQQPPQLQHPLTVTRPASNTAQAINGSVHSTPLNVNTTK